VSWLQAHTGWLLVLDNVEDIEHIRPLLGQVAANGRVLMTTRRDLGTARWRQLGVHPVRLGPLDRAASVELLVELTGQDDPDGAARLAQDLGDLPLALEQAAAYIAQHHAMTFDAYRAKLATKFTKVADAIARIWQVTLDTIQDPLASTVLSVLGWLAPDGVPIDVLEPLGEDVDDAVALLVSYNMISISENAISVHRLVQAVTRTDDTRAVATGLLLDAIPENPENLAVPDMLRWNRLLPHIDALLSHGHIDQDVLYLTDQAATFRAFHGQNATAIAMLERLVENSRRLNGEDHLSIAGAWLRLGIACWTAGRNTDAVAPFEQGAQACRRILGDDHPDTLTVRHHLAYAYRAAGRVQEARAQFEALYADSRRLLGVDDRDTKLIAEELKTVRGVR
jgi:tetratricopeptide (TPR) repeat protein